MTRRAECNAWRRMDHALRHARAYPHPAGRIVRFETHICVVYLAGRYAYKIAKPVNLGFVDLSHANARLACCLAALQLNRQLAAQLYVGVVPVMPTAPMLPAVPIVPAPRRSPTPPDRRHIRTMQPLDYALKMHRFDERALFSARIARGVLSADDIDEAAVTLATFHRRASPRVPNRAYGTTDLLRIQIEAVLAGLAAKAPDLLRGHLAAWCEAELQHLGPHLAARRNDGFVRECHGDVHLDNIVRWRGRVTIFDCVEFDPALRWTDVMADVAFLVMDLLAHERADLATSMLLRWLAETGDYGGLAALRLYVVYRALVRALVATLKAPRDPHARELAGRYVALAAQVVRPARGALILCHGFSGAGKSVASAALATHIGAIRLGSDTERKRPAGMLRAPQAEKLPPTAYTRATIDANYTRLAALAGALLDAGYPVLVDASFLERRHRAAFIELANARAAPVAILDVRAAPALILARLRERARAAAEPSDADERVLAGQFERAEPLSAEEAALTIAIDTNVPRTALESDAFWAPLCTAMGIAGWLAGGSPIRACDKTRVPDSAPSAYLGY